MSNSITNQEKFMLEALKQAKKAYSEGEVPIGAVIVRNGEIIARGRNKRERTNSAIAHAEIVAIIKASNKLKSWRLDDCELYVTIEPCVMCAGAILNARIKKVYYGAPDKKGGAVDSDYKVLDNNSLNWNAEHEGGFFSEEAIKLMQNFFAERRKTKK